MKNFKKKFEVLGIQRLKNSYYDNPRYALVLIDEEGEYISCTTTPNINCAYAMGDHMQGRMWEFTYHNTPSGDMRIDYFN